MSTSSEHGPGAFTLAESDTEINKDTMVNLLGLDLSVSGSVRHYFSALVEWFPGVNTPLETDYVRLLQIKLSIQQNHNIAESDLCTLRYYSK